MVFRIKGGGVRLGKRITPKVSSGGFIVPLPAPILWAERGDLPRGWMLRICECGGDRMDSAEVTQNDDDGVISPTKHVGFDFKTRRFYVGFSVHLSSPKCDNSDAGRELAFVEQKLDRISGAFHASDVADWAGGGRGEHDNADAGR